jgi:uncharacterized membrane protein YphA (DoxX/SURF4 family)
MLNIFPDLLFLQLLAPFLLRVAIGIMFIWVGYSYVSKDRAVATSQLKTKWPKTASAIVWVSGMFEIVAGLFLVVGFLTQIAAIAGILIAAKALCAKLLYKDLDKVAKYSKMFYILVLIVSLSLLVSGAGAFAFDLPL